MSFQFRRRVDVREQSPQQEPFFQNSVQQQGQGIYPQMEQPAQGYDPRFNMPGQIQPMPAPPFLQANPGNFYGQQQYAQQPMMNQQQQGYGFGPPPGMPGQQVPSQHPGMMSQESYMHPLNAQRSNYQGNNFQPGPQSPGFQGFAAPGQLPHPQSNGSFVQDETRQDGVRPNGASPMAFWHETQAASGFDDSESETANSPVKLLVAVAGVALIAAFSWFAYKWAKAPSSDTPPLIHAELGPYKVSPDHRGGLNIPYQDKLIYNRIGDGAAADPAERLLPPPEQPEIIQNNQGNQEQNFDANQNATQQPMYSEMPAPQYGVQQPQANVPPPQIKQQNIPLQPQVAQQPTSEQPVVDTPKKKAEEKEDTDEPTVTKTKTKSVTKSVESLGGNFFVQLATVKSEVAALREWKRLKAKYSLIKMKSQIKESEMPDGEVVYRLLMGPFTEKVKALKHAVKIDGTKVVHVTD